MVALLEVKTVEGGTPIGEAVRSKVTRYQYTNHLDSASLELDENALVLSYEEYHPFGTTSYSMHTNDSEVSQKRYKYVHKERDDETGLYYYGARYYAAWLCRFVSVDPLKDKYPFYTTYQYTGNNPITFTDLDGKETTPNEVTNVGTNGQENNQYLWVGTEHTPEIYSYDLYFTSLTFDAGIPSSQSTKAPPPDDPTFFSVLFNLGVYNDSAISRARHLAHVAGTSEDDIIELDNQTYIVPTLHGSGEDQIMLFSVFRQIKEGVSYYTDSMNDNDDLFLTYEELSNLDQIEGQEIRDVSILFGAGGSTVKNGVYLMGKSSKSRLLGEILKAIKTTKKIDNIAGAKKAVDAAKTSFKSFNSLDDLGQLFKSKSLANVSDDLVKSGWKELEGNWGTRTVFEKQIGNQRYYAQWEVNAVHSTTNQPVGYWKLTYGKINATSKNTIRVSPSSNFKP